MFIVIIWNIGLPSPVVIPLAAAAIAAVYVSPCPLAFFNADDNVSSNKKATSSSSTTITTTINFIIPKHVHHFIVSLITHGVSFNCRLLDCISRKPSNELTAFSEPTIIHQISLSFVCIMPSNVPILAHPAQAMISRSPTVSLKSSKVSALTTSVPTTTKLLQTALFFPL
jgi:hypothetical protein